MSELKKGTNGKRQDGQWTGANGLAAKKKKKHHHKQWTGADGSTVVIGTGATYPAVQIHPSLFNGSAHKVLGKKANILNMYLNSNATNPELTLGQFLSLNKITSGDLLSGLPSKVAPLLPSSGATAVKTALNTVNQSMYHRRAKTIQSRLALLAEFLSTKPSGTFFSFLSKKGITPDQFQEGLPKNLKNPAVFNNTAVQIMPYANDVNAAHVEQFSNYINTHASGTPESEIVNSFEADVPESELSDSVYYNANAFAFNPRMFRGNNPPPAPKPKPSPQYNAPPPQPQGGSSAHAGNPHANYNLGIKTTPAQASPTPAAVSMGAIVPNVEYVVPAGLPLPNMQPQQGGGGGGGYQDDGSGGTESGSDSGENDNSQQDDNSDSQQGGGNDNSGDFGNEDIDNSDDTSSDDGSDDSDDSVDNGMSQEMIDSMSESGSDEDVTGADGNKYGFSIKLKIFGTNIDTKKVSLKSALHLLNKFNPATFLLRDAVGGLFDINMLGMATDIGKEKDKGSSSWGKITDIWSTLGGEDKNLGNMIERGRNKNKVGVDGQNYNITATDQKAISGGSVGLAGVISAVSPPAAPVAVPAAAVIASVAKVLPIDAPSAQGIAAPPKTASGLDQQTLDALNAIAGGQDTSSSSASPVVAAIKKNGKYIAMAVGGIVVLFVLMSLAGGGKKSAA